MNYTEEVNMKAVKAVVKMRGMSDWLMNWLIDFFNEHNSNNNTEIHPETHIQTNKPEATRNLFECSEFRIEDNY